MRDVSHIALLAAIWKSREGPHTTSIDMHHQADVATHYSRSHPAPWLRIEWHRREPFPLEYCNWQRRPGYHCALLRILCVLIERHALNSNARPADRSAGDETSSVRLCAEHRASVGVARFLKTGAILVAVRIGGAGYTGARPIYGADFRHSQTGPRTIIPRTRRETPRSPHGVPRAQTICAT